MIKKDWAQGIQGFFNLSKSINVIGHIVKLKDKNHTIILSDAEKDLTKFSTYVWWKLSRKFGIEENYLNIIKAICNTHIDWEEMSHWKRPWWWERMKAGGEGDDRGWDDWMTSLTQWTWVWASSGSWWWAGKTGMLQSMGLQGVRHNWVMDLNWTQHCESTTL